MHNTKNGNKRLLSMSRVAPKRDTEEMDTVIMSVSILSILIILNDYA